MTAAECVAEAVSNGLAADLEQLEGERQEMRRRNRQVLWWGAGLAAAAGVVELVKGWGWLAVAITAVVVTVICLVIVSGRKRKVGSRYKDVAISGLLDHALPELEYSAWRYLDEDEFTGCGLFIAPDRYSGKDYFTGTIDKTALRFSLVHAEERYETTTTETDSDGHTTTRTEEHWRDIFKGLLFVADFNKHFQGRTLVRSGKAGLLSGLSRTLVKLEDPRFSSMFTVHGHDQVEARYLLTPALMERLMELRSSLGSFEVSFCNSEIVIAAEGFPYDAFEPDTGRPCTDQQQLASILGWIFQVVNVVDDLDLNTRIWSKS